jgi:predicted Zn-dependent protease
MKLEPPDIHYCRAAEGWLELGNHREAHAELEKVRATYWEHPLVLMVRWKVCARAGQWHLAVNIAQAVLDLEPEKPFGWIHRAFALHELRRTQEAWDGLLPVAEKFSDEPLIPYYLACYACRLGRLSEARSWLAKAFEAGDRDQVRSMALHDPDLEPLWNQLFQIH